MKIKKFLSGIFAAIMSIVLIAAPLSTAIAVKADPTETTDINEDKCTIIINHAASTGTYTAYPIFVGNVEMEVGNDGKETGRKLISNPKFHENLETMINSGQVVSRTESDDYGLWTYLKTTTTKVNNKSFMEIIKAYDPNTSLNNFSISTTADYSKQAETLANILNLTSQDTNAVTGIYGILKGSSTSSFYSAFAEATRLFMLDNVDGKTKDDLTNTKVGTLADGKVTIEVDTPGYYLIEYTPADYEATDYESTPKKVRRSLVLVGKGKELSATINSKDTQNIASVDVQFNKNILDKATCECDTPTYKYTDDESSFDTEGNWAKNVSAGNGDYVNCRVVVTLPGNLAAYEQYYLAVPIMYGYAKTNHNEFDYYKSITRQGNTENVKVYFLNNEGNKKEINITENNIKSTDYTYANNSTSNNGGLNVEKDYFVANETFVFTDIANIKVQADETTEPLLAKDSNYNKLVIEFPVKFERFSKDMDTFNSSSVGADSPGFDGSNSSTLAYTGDDLLLKNYITAKAVYSNNPNLKALKEGETAYGTDNTDGVKLYLDTTKAVGSLQNPVGIAKESSANIVTYRLRVHATTEEIRDKSYGGLEGVYFAIKNKDGRYAKVKKIEAGTIKAIRSYDEIDDENFYTNAGSLGNYGKGFTNLYTITEWGEVEKDTVYKDDNGSVTLNSDYVMQTNNAQTTYGINKATYNTGRFEIIGLAPGTYTVVALEEAIKAREDITSTGDEYKEYSISKENGKPKTEYKFSFDPELLNDCTKLPYNTHYAPSNFDSTTLHTNFNNSTTNHHEVAVSNLITNFKMKWYDMEGTEITKEKADWWLGQRDDVNLMSMRITYIKKGLSLPVTGGIGTFIFYAVGGVLVIISIVAIITKIRIKREQL